MESDWHKALKRRLAGKTGRTEVKIRGGERLDVQKGRVVAEVERHGRIRQALLRLKTKKTLRKVLRVPQKDLEKAAAVAKAMKMRVTITNLRGTRRRIVRE